MFYRSSGPAVAVLAWVIMALPAGAQNTATTAKVRFVQPDGTALPASLFVVRDARGLEIAPRAEPYGAFSFSDVGRKVTFEFAKKTNLKNPGIELVLEDAPT